MKDRPPPDPSAIKDAADTPLLETSLTPQQAEQLAKWFHTQHPSQLTESAEEVPAPTEEELEILRSLGYVR